MNKQKHSRRSGFDLNQTAVAAPDFAKGKIIRLTASIALALYGYEVLAQPLVSAAEQIVPAQEASVAADAAFALYVPQRGEGSAEVAQRFGVSEAELIALRTQVAAYNWSDSVWLVPKSSTGEAALYPGYVLYTLKKGERLDSLALRVNRSVRELARLNSQLMGEAAVAGLSAGDVMVLPAPQAKNAKAAERDDRAFENRLAQGVSQTAQQYQQYQDSQGKSGAVSAGDMLAQQAASGASAALSQGAEQFLNGFGRAKVNVRASAETNDVDLELDYLHPLLQSNEDILFGQIGYRTFDERNIANVGLGYRKQVTPNLMLGANAFVDQDFSNSHTRGGVGVEAWADEARLAANAYAPLSGWKESDRDHLNTDPLRFDLQERAASGWDVRAEVALPGTPKLAGTVKYFQWNGDGVDAFGGGRLEKDPKGYSIGAKWQPIPLLGFTAERQKIHGGDGQWQVGASLNWSFDLSLDEQLNPDKATALRPLSEARKDFVQREYNVVLDYQQKEKKTAQTVPFAFMESLLREVPPPASAAASKFIDSPALQGVRAGATLEYVKGAVDLGMSTFNAVQLSTTVNPSTGQVEIPPGISPRSIEVMARQRVNGAVVGETTYKLMLMPTAGTPIVDVTDIKGVLNVGETLVGEYSFDANGGDATDASTMLWTGGATADTDANYTLTQADVGAVLTFSVTAKNGAGQMGNTDSIDTATAPGVIEPGQDTVLVIGTDANGRPVVGSPLTAQVSCVTACAPTMSYQWQIETQIGSDTYTNIAGATGQSYTPTKDDQKRKIIVQVSKP